MRGRRLERVRRGQACKRRTDYSGKEVDNLSVRAREDFKREITNLRLLGMGAQGVITMDMFGASNNAQSHRTFSRPNLGV